MQSLSSDNFNYENQMQVSGDSQMSAGGLLELIDKILDKGLVINGDVTIAFAGVELLSLRINLVLASLETAKKYGIELPWEKWSNASKTPDISAGSGQTLPNISNGTNNPAGDEGTYSNENSPWLQQEQPPAYNKIRSQKSSRNARKKLAKVRNPRSNVSSA